MAREEELEGALDLGSVRWFVVFVLFFDTSADQQKGTCSFWLLGHFLAWGLGREEVLEDE